MFEVFEDGILEVDSNFAEFDLIGSPMAAALILFLTPTFWLTGCA